MTNKREWNRRHGFPQDKSNTIREISILSKPTLKTLQTVYNRGVGAHKTNPQSVRVKHTFKKDPKVPIHKKLSKEQWGMARVYSFVNKLEGKTTLNHDKDLL